MLLLLGVIGLVAALALGRNQLSQFLRILGHTRWYFIGFIILLQLLSYFINALYYRSIVRVFGYNLPTFRLFEGALASNFANYILPSAGVAGAGFLSQVLSPEVPRGEGTLTQFMRYAFSTLATIIMLPIGITLVVLGHTDTSGASYVVRSSVLCLVVILIFSACIVLLVRREATLNRYVNWVMVKLGRWMTDDRKQSVSNFIEEFYTGIHSMARNRRRLVRPFIWSIVYMLIAVAILYMIFPALGGRAVIGTVIMAYLLATIVSVFGGELISTGVFEVGMAATFVALGEPLTLAASVTILYKFLNLSIGLPLGFYYYNKYLPK